MSGLDNSQPITDETVLRDADLVDQIATKETAGGDTAEKDADADELGDATPGPR